MSVLDELRAMVPPVEGGSDQEETWELLRTRITVLSSRAWEGRVRWDLVERWLKNFNGGAGYAPEVERLHALYILAQFLYFGSREIRVLLRALYRDLFLLPLIQEARTSLGGTRDEALIWARTLELLSRTRFLGVGNPSESGVHLLYYFRQENGLSKNHFLDTAQIITRVEKAGKYVRALRHADVDRYVFVDDVCGSGETAVNYSKDFLEEVRGLKPDTRFVYLALFATEEGMETLRKDSIFGQHSAAVYELDATYKCVSADSRYLKVAPNDINPDIARQLVLKYGSQLLPGHPTGYKEGELLLGFHHNTPDNTLPIIWMDPSHGAAIPWTPIFRRYPKI